MPQNCIKRHIYWSHPVCYLMLFYQRLIIHYGFLLAVMTCRARFQRYARQHRQAAPENRKKFKKRSCQYTTEKLNYNLLHRLTLQRCASEKKYTNNMSITWITKQCNTCVIYPSRGLAEVRTVCACSSSLTEKERNFLDSFLVLLFHHHHYYYYYYYYYSYYYY